MSDDSWDAVIDAAILDHLPRQRIKDCYAQAPGDELRGKFVSQESSAALVANAFGLFLDQPTLLEGLLGGPPVSLRLECELRFPWSGGRHPWLDVVIETTRAVVGVESKRYEPFRGRVSGGFLPAFDRPVWGGLMDGYQEIRDLLRSDPGTFSHLDAARLAKRARGLRSAVQGGREYQGKRPVLVYLYSEPLSWPDGRAIDRNLRTRHRTEIDQFASG